MKKNQNFIIAFVIITIIIILLCFILFNKKDSMGGGIGGANNHSKPSNTTNSVVTPLTVLKNYNTFFAINNVINNYYTNLENKDSGALIGIIDNVYQITNSLNISNIYNHLKPDVDEVTYYSKKIYVKSLNEYSYYFVNGEAQNYDFGEEILTEENNVNYLVIVNTKDQVYSITPLGKVNISSYANEYKINERKIINKNGYNVYEENELSDENVAVFYLSYYQTLLYLNTEKAYNMLESKTNYPTLEVFTRNLESLYKYINTNLLSYGAKGQDGNKSYSVIMDNQNRMTLKEQSIMNFTVNFG